jgi:hypothetical protein
MTKKSTAVIRSFLIFTLLLTCALVFSLYLYGNSQVEIARLKASQEWIVVPLGENSRAYKLNQRTGTVFLLDGVREFAVGESYPSIFKPDARQLPHGSKVEKKAATQSKELQAGGDKSSSTRPLMRLERSRKIRPFKDLKKLSE